MTDKNSSRWKRIELWDLGCLFYWCSIFITFCIIFSWPLDFDTPLHLETAPRKFVFLMLFWGGSIVMLQTFFGVLGSLKAILKFFKSPFTAIRIFSGFLWDSKSLLKKYLKQIPTRQIFFILLIAVPVLGLTEQNPAVLRILSPIAWVTLIWLLYSCFKWTLNPIPFGTKLAQASSKLKVSAVDKLSRVQTSNFENVHAELIKHLENFKLIINVFPKVINFLKGPKLLFTFFTVIFLFGAIGSLVLVSTILRIEHILTPGGVFTGAFFNGNPSDFFYISLNQFVSSEVYNVTPTAIGVRYILSFLPASSIILTLLLVLAFSMVAQNAIDNTFKDFGNGLLSTIEEATKNISEKREIVVIDQRKDSKTVTASSTTTVSTEV